MVQHWIDKTRHFLWPEQSLKAGWRGRVVCTGRLLFRIGEDFVDFDIALRAMSLVFTTLLALVPLLAVSFSVSKGLGYHNQIEPLLLQLLEPAMGEKGIEITGVIIGFVENIKVGVLGSLGIALLFYSAFSLIQKVEQAFNNIWRLKQSRSLLRRMSDYLSVLVIGPVLIITAIGVSALLIGSDIAQTILEIEPLGQLYRTFVGLVPFLLIIAAFTFFYAFIPNTRVKVRAALLGGVVSGIVWQITSWIFAAIIVGSAKYSAIYSGFATLLFLIIWVNINWLILLLGADLVYHLQHSDNLAVSQRRLKLSIANKESLALRVLCIIGQAYYAGRQGATVRELVEKLKVPEGLLGEILDFLKEAGLANESVDDEILYAPARPFDETSVKFALDRLRSVPFSTGYILDEDKLSSIYKLNDRVDQALQGVTGSVSLKQLALEDQEF